MQKQFDGKEGFSCSDDGESVFSQSVLIDEAVVLSANNRLVLLVDEKRSNNATHPFLDVHGKVVLGGTLTVRFASEPKLDELESYFAIRSNTDMDGRFAKIESDFPTSFDVLRYKLVTRGDYQARELHVTTQLVDNWARHPVRSALIVLSVFGCVLTVFALLIAWRKRQWERSRRSMLASHIDLSGTESDDYELGDFDKRDQGYEAAAKLIEQRDGRFEIGDDAEL